MGGRQESVQCGALDGFDLCELCQRAGVWADKHARRHPNHRLGLVSRHSAPLVGKQPQLRNAPSAPPPPRPTHGTAISARVAVPFEAKSAYEWTQHSAEVHLSVALPPGTRARELAVVVQPFLLSVSLKALGVILRGSFHRGVRHKETVWTIEEVRRRQADQETTAAVSACSRARGRAREGEPPSPPSRLP